MRVTEAIVRKVCQGRPMRTMRTMRTRTRTVGTTVMRDVRDIEVRTSDGYRREVK